MSKMFGNVVNRIMENDKISEEIKVGTKATEYLYSDRYVWEVIEVKSQKDIVLRQMSAKAKASYSNEWELYSDKNNRVIEVVFRYNNWYEKYVDYSGKVCYDKIKIVFGRADYYYDYSFQEYVFTKDKIFLIIFQKKY